MKKGKIVDGGSIIVTTEQLQEEFKQILAYGYKRGNEETSISTQDLVQELVEMMKKAMIKMEEQA